MVENIMYSCWLGLRAALRYAAADAAAAAACPSQGSPESLAVREHENPWNGGGNGDGKRENIHNWIT